jgi:hypothetical protein
VVAREADLAERRHLGNRRHALVGIDQQRRDLAAADIGQEVAKPEKADRRHAGQHVGDGVTTALERHAYEISTGLLLPVLHEIDQRGRRRGIGQCAGVLLRISGELVHALHAELGANPERLGDVEEIGDGVEALERIVGQTLLGELVIGQGLARHDAQRVTVGCCLSAGAGAQDHEAAGAVFDHHGLPQPLVQRLRQRPHEHVAEPAGAGRHDHADRTVGIGLRGGRHGAKLRHQRCKNGECDPVIDPTGHGSPPKFCARVGQKRTV